MRDARGRMEAWIRKRSASRRVFLLFGLAEVAGFFIVFIGLTRLLVTTDFAGELGGVIGLLAAIVTVLWIDHLCAYKTGRCFMPYRDGVPKLGPPGRAGRRRR